ncbi:MAG: hypothetical protein QY331_07530 [Melioribacteraceae bacterium]|nr:MAG: hypothetical protein QY331_07530 [Melioribacteraceae bacterium]
MKVTKLFNALNNDNMNSGLVVIVAELEKQGYKVELEGVEVSSKNMLDENIFEDFERASKEFKIRLLKNGNVVDKFMLEAIDYHEYKIKKYD